MRLLTNCPLFPWGGSASSSPIISSAGTMIIVLAIICMRYS